MFSATASQPLPSDIQPGHPLHRLQEAGATLRLAEPLVLGHAIDIGSGSATCALDREAMRRASQSDDPTLQMAGQVGSYVKFQIGPMTVFASVRGIRSSSADKQILADLDFVGEAVLSAETGKLSGFVRGVTRYPVPGEHLLAIDNEELRTVFGGSSAAHISIGAVYPTRDVPARLNIDPLLSRHFALLGSTGTGKSTTTAMLLHRIIEQSPHGHIIMLDPHGEYGRAFEKQGVVYDATNLELPYWLMNLQEHIEVIIGERTSDTEVDVDCLSKCLATARAKTRTASELGRVTVDSPVPYLLSDLLGAIQSNMGKLEKPEKLAPYLRLKSKIEELRNNPRYSFMFSGMLVSDNLESMLSRIFRMPSNGKPISIIDLSSVPSDVVNVVVAIMGRLIFDFAIWSRQDENRPILLVCEEAHRYVPNERLDRFGLTRHVLERIAKEGRKYGVSLGLVTQRPSDLSESVLSQCGTIISLRMNNDRDQAFVRNAMPEGSRGMLEAIPALRNRECIVVGEGVAFPMRVRLSNLDEDLRPASADPQFADQWSKDPAQSDLIARVIRRWRVQGQ